MAVDLTQLGAVSYGLVSQQLKSYTVQESPIIRDQVGRVLTRIEFSGEGELCADTPAELAVKVAGVMLAFNQDGGNLLVNGIGGQLEYGLAAATCFDNGPHVSCEIKAGPATLTKMVTYKAWALCPPPGLTNPVDVYRVEFILRADGLLTVRRTGQLIGANNVAYATATTIPAFRKLYPLPNWSVTAQYTTGMDQNLSVVTYRLEATQMAKPMAAVNENVFAVEQEQTISIERDENYRKLTTYGFNVLMPPTADPVAMVTFLRSQVVGPILRESVQFSVTKENRVQASFTCLTSADASQLMNLQQTLRVMAPTFVYEMKTYVGADPILVQGPAVYGRITQSGTAIAALEFLKAPSPILGFLSQQPSITYTNLNEVEKQTTWDYEMFAANDQGEALSAGDVNSLSLNSIARSFLDLQFKLQSAPDRPPLQ